MCASLSLMDIYATDRCRPKTKSTWLQIQIYCPVLQYMSCHMFQNPCIVAVHQVSLHCALATERHFTSVKAANVRFILVDEACFAYESHLDALRIMTLIFSLPFRSRYGKYSVCLTPIIFCRSSGCSSLCKLTAMVRSADSEKRYVAFPAP